MPLSRPSAFSAVRSAAGESGLPSSETGSPFSKPISMVGRLVGRFLGRERALEDVGRRLDVRVLQHFSFRGGVQQVGVDGEGRLAALVLGDEDLVLLGEVDQVGARLELPFPPGRDDLDVGVERVGRQLEAHLVVALAGGAVGDRVGARVMGDLDEALGDERAGDRGAEQVDAFVERVHAEHREDEVAHEFLAQILDVDLLDAEHLGLAARRLQLLALAEIGGESHHLGAVGRLQPFQDDRGVEAAGIGEHDLFDVTRHDGSNGVGKRRAL